MGEQIVFISGEADTPGHSYRVVRLADAARGAGATAATFRIEDAPDHLAVIARADLVFLWRAAFDEAVDQVVKTVRAAGSTLIFDLDDLMFEPDLAKTHLIDGIRTQGLTEAQVRAHYSRVQTTFSKADYCTAPTPLLAQRMRIWGKPSFVIPNGFDEDVLQRSRIAARKRRSKTDDGLVRIGYASGSRTHQKDFAQAAEGIARLLHEHPNCRLVLFQHCGVPVLEPAEFPGLHAVREQIEWRDLVPLHELPNELANFDINLAPLEAGNLFCEAKSELKYFEAALVDVPTVASPTEPYRNAIRNGETGFLATTPDEWYSSLAHLAESRELRYSIGRAAFNDALVRYGPEKRVETFVSVMEQALHRGRRAARAFELQIRRSAAARTETAFVPPHRVLFETDRLQSAEVTVVIPLYNYERHIVEALDSVRDQTLETLDIVVVDDKSTDTSLTLARDWLIRNQARFNRAILISNVQNSGLGFSRNVGFSVAETPYVLTLDADNHLLGECARLCLERIKATGAGYVYPTIQTFGDTQHRISNLPYDAVRLISGNYIDAMALVRKAAWADVGGYRHVRFGWEDYDFWCKLAEKGWFGVHLPEILAGYRVHKRSMLRVDTNLAPNTLRLIQNMLQEHPWLRVEPPLPAPATDTPPEPKALPPVPPLPTLRREPIEQDQRLDRLLSILRCPKTGEALQRTPDGNLITVDSRLTWPVVDGRPILFPDLGTPKLMPYDHVSNEVPLRAMELIRATNGLVLNLSAGGTAEFFDHVIEAEAAIFRHTDVLADAHALPFADEAFEVVIAMNAFEHYHTPPAVVQEIYRVLKPGGRVLIRTAFLQPLHEPPWHFYNCTRFGLERWFAPFDTLDLEVSENLNPSYAVSWLMSEAEEALRRDVSSDAADLFRGSSCGEIIELWRDPGARKSRLWRNFYSLSRERQEALAAGFEYLGRKPISVVST